MFATHTFLGVIFLLCLTTIGLHAQTDSITKPVGHKGLYPVQAGIAFYSAFYNGDLTQRNGLQGFGPGLDLSLKFDSPKRVSPVFNVGFGSFSAEQRDIPASQGIQPNTFVQTSFWYVDLMLRIHIINRGNPKQAPNSRSGYPTEPRLRPYLAFGLGVLGFTPRDRNGNLLSTNTNTRAQGENYGNTTAFFPLALGVTHRLSPVLSVGVELRRMFTFTQYLDNIGQLGSGAADAVNTLGISLYVTPAPAKSQ